MDNSQKRYELIDYILKVGEPELEELYESLKQSFTYNKELVLLSDKQKQSIMEGMRDIEESRVFPHEEVMQEAEECLKK